MFTQTFSYLQDTQKKNLCQSVLESCSVIHKKPPKIKLKNTFYPLCGNLQQSLRFGAFLPSLFSKMQNNSCPQSLRQLQFSLYWKWMVPWGALPLQILLTQGFSSKQGWGSVKWLSWFSLSKSSWKGTHVVYEITAEMCAQHPGTELINAADSAWVSIGSGVNGAIQAKSSDPGAFPPCYSGNTAPFPSRTQGRAVPAFLHSSSYFLSKLWGKGD